MKTRHMRLAVLSALLLAGTAGALAAAQEPLLLAQTDVRREDRQADRQADRRQDRREDRQADRREDRREDRQADRRQDDAGNQTIITLPRDAAGQVDRTRLVDAVEAAFAAGAHEIQIRGGNLTQQEARDLFLAVGQAPNLMRQLADAMPAGTRELSVRVRSGAVDARVQRQSDGSLRLRVENANLTGFGAAERAQRAQQLSQQFGFDRVRLSGVDADGRRVRTEFREDKGLVANVVAGQGNLARGADDGNASSHGQNAGGRREDRQADRQEDRREDRQADRREDRQADRREDRQADRREDRQADRREDRQVDRREDRQVDRPERVSGEDRGRPERAERPPRPERPERPERPDRPERPEKPERPERPEGGGRGRG